MDPDSVIRCWHISVYCAPKGGLSGRKWILVDLLLLRQLLAAIIYFRLSAIKGEGSLPSMPQAVELLNLLTLMFVYRLTFLVVFYDDGRLVVHVLDCLSLECPRWLVCCWWRVLRYFIALYLVMV